MKYTQFDLEVFFAKYEFSAPYLLCSSDCEAMSIGELLALEDGATEAFHNQWLGYTESPGDPELRELVASRYQTLNAENTIILSGAQEGILLFSQTVLRPDDHVIVLFPAYQSLYQVAEDMGCEVTRWQLEDDEHNVWSLDLDFLRDNIRENTRAVFINTPHNPTGYVIPDAMLDEIVTICREHDLYLFCDEVYRELELNGAPKAISASDKYEKAIALGVMSKAYGLAGLRIGWVASQDKTLLSDILNQKFYTTICNSAPSEFLAKVALKNADALLNRNRTIIETNIHHINQFIADYPNIFCWTPPQAGSIAFPRLVLDTPSDEFCTKLVKNQGVLLAPSTQFNFGTNHFRLGLGRTNLAEGIEQLAHFVTKYIS